MERLSEQVLLVRAANHGPLTLDGTNTYLVGAPAWVVDPGPPDAAHVARVLEAAAGRGGVAGIALTHRHLDHAGAVPLLLEHLDAEVVAGAPGTAGGRFGEPSAEDLGPTRIVRDGDRAGPFEVIETPGHAADHIALRAGGEIFCGDTVLGEGSVFIPPGGGSLSSYLESLRRLRELDPDVLYPGHGPVVRDPGAKLDEYIAHRLDRERRLVEALDRGLRGTGELLDAVWDDAPPALRHAAALTLETHLDKLEQEGRLPDGVERLAV